MFRQFINFLLSPFGTAFEGECACCGACCRNLILVDNGRPVRAMSQFEKLRKRKPAYSRFKPLEQDSPDEFLYFKCTMLGDDNKCTDYNNRPDICRHYPQKAMLRHGGKLLDGCGYYIKGKKSFARELERAQKNLRE